MQNAPGDDVPQTINVGSGNVDKETAPHDAAGGENKHEPSPENEIAAGAEPTLKGKARKPLRFHLAFLSLLVMVFIVSVDATALAVALPVSCCPQMQQAVD